MNRDITTNEYRFNEARHLHQLLVDGKWKNLTGCTTILGVLAKPALIQWAANMACDHIRDNAPREVLEHLSEFKQYIVSEDLLKEARTAHARRKEKAGDWGTEMHAWVELFINAVMEKSTTLMPPDLKQIECAEHFMKWMTDNNVKFIASERAVYSKNLFLGGIVDIICEIDGECWLADIKTGSGIYYEAFWQMAGYQIMLEEMGFDKPIKGHIVLNLKKDGTFEEKRSISTDDCKKGFLACVDIYRIQEKIKNQII